MKLNERMFMKNTVVLQGMNNISRIAICDLFLKFQGAKCPYFLKIHDTKNN